MPDAFGEFIAGLAQWDWWGTITFRNEVPCPDAGVKRVESWLDDVAKSAAPSMGYVLAEEFGGLGGRFHCHFLLSGVKDLRRTFWWSELFRRFGYSEIKPFDPDQGAAFYTAKYAAKQLGNLHFGGFLEAQEITQSQDHFELAGQGSPATAKRGCEVAPSANMPRDFYRMTSKRWHR